MAVFDGKKDLASKLGPIVEALQSQHFVYAVMLAEEKGFSDSILEYMRQNLEVRRFI